MHKPASITIAIPQPCTQNWDAMTPVAQGRHCDSCNSIVIDFTTWSDAALYNFFSKNDGHVCGRYLATQLNRPIQIPHQPHSRLYRLAIAMGLTLMFTQVPSLYAQSKPPLTTTNPSAATEQRGGNEIRGTVTDDRKEPVVTASVQVYSDGILKGGAVTDFDGNYSIKPLDEGEYEVRVTYVGCDTATQKNVEVRNDRLMIANAVLHSRVPVNIPAVREYKLGAGLWRHEYNTHILTAEEVKGKPSKR